jgi:hypothetical protein
MIISGFEGQTYTDRVPLVGEGSLLFAYEPAPVYRDYFCVPQSAYPLSHQPDRFMEDRVGPYSDRKGSNGQLLISCQTSEPPTLKYR